MNKKLILSLFFRVISLADVHDGLSQDHMAKECGQLKSDAQLEDSIIIIDVEKILKTNPEHMEALLQASRSASNLVATVAGQNQKAFYIQRAFNYAQRSIQLEPGSKEAHLNYIIALGLLSEIAKNPAEKLRHANVIKAQADYLLSIDSLYAPAHFTLGKWHLSLASLSWLEQAACDILFGGMPREASLETALRCFEKAIQLQPENILFQYNKALALHKLGRSVEAVNVLKCTLKIPLQETNDSIRRNNCIALLNQLYQ